MRLSVYVGHTTFFEENHENSFVSQRLREPPHVFWGEPWEQLRELTFTLGQPCLEKNNDNVYATERLRGPLNVF